jgi:hypothetical protein
MRPTLRQLEIATALAAGAFFIGVWIVYWRTIIFLTMVLLDVGFHKVFG